MFLLLRENHSENAVQECFSEVSMATWLEMSVCCAASTKGHWKESWFCTEYKNTLMFIQKIMLTCVVLVETLLPLSLFASQ